MKKLFLFAVVCCGIISASAEEPQYPKNAAQAAQEAQAACEEWGKNAAPGTNNEHAGVIKYGAGNSDSNSNNSNNAVNGNARGSFFGFGASVDGNHSNGNSNTQNNNNTSSGTLYYKCE